MAATILAGVAQHALGYPTPKQTPGSELTATSPQQTVTRKVRNKSRIAKKFERKKLTKMVVRRTWPLRFCKPRL
jgi:hypothetical protein